jgi:hypothetical protein
LQIIYFCQASLSVTVLLNTGLPATLSATK